MPSAMDRPEVVVVGAGIIGVSTAYALARRGRRVLVLDGRGIGAGCSAGNAGLVVPSHSVPLAAPGMVAAGLRSLLARKGAFRLRVRPELSFLRWLWRFRAACRREQVRRAIPVLRDLARASAALYTEMETRGDLG